MAQFLPPVLAFSFASPLLLWGLGLAAVPILIHLFFRQPHQETSWAAMRFLLAATRKVTQRLRLEQLILLAVRTLTLLFLVTAFARPHFESLGLAFTGQVPVHRVIVLDASYSMGLQTGGTTCFARAKDLARQIVEQGKRGDAVNLVRICNSPPYAIIAEASFSKNAALDEIDRLQLTDEPGNLRAAVNAVSSMLDDPQAPGRKEICLISDFQQSGWSELMTSGDSAVRETFEQFARRARLILVDVGQAQPRNRAVTRLEIEEPLARIGRPVHLHALVHGYGGESLNGLPVELYLDGRLAQTTHIEASAADEARLYFEQEFAAGDDHVLEVRLAGDALPIDDRRWLSLRVRDTLRVLLVNGRHSGGVLGRSTDYLRLALSPEKDALGRTGLIVPDVIDDGELPAVDLGRYDCVFLCNVARFTPQEVDALRAYAKSGGGLIFCLGDRVDLQHYNRDLYAAGRGILPARLERRVGDPNSAQDYFYLDPQDLQHPVVSAFQGNPGTGLEEVLTFAYVQAQLPEQTQAAVALRFNTGDPAIVDGGVGHGRSILLTTWVDGNWSTWAYSRSFAPLMHELVFHAVSSRQKQRQLTVGDALVWPLPSHAFQTPVSVELPGGGDVPLAVRESDDRPAVVFDATLSSGVYRLKMGPPVHQVEAFAVNLDTRESDLARLSENDLRRAMPGAVDFTYATETQEIPRTVPSAEPAPNDLTRWLLAATLCLVIVEQIMAWNFVYGIGSLYGVVALAVVPPLVERHAGLGLLVMGLMATGFLVLWGLQRRRTSGSRFRIPAGTRRG